MLRNELIKPAPTSWELPPPPPPHHRPPLLPHLHPPPLRDASSVFGPRHLNLPPPVTVKLSYQYMGLNVCISLHFSINDNVLLGKIHG